MTFQEIADLQGCPLSTVKTRLYQGLIVLRRRLQRRGTRSLGDGAVMTLVMRCDEKDRLVGYLYGECSAAERAAVEAHLSRCAVVCGRTRRFEGCARLHLAGWNAPDDGPRLPRHARASGRRPPRPGRGAFLHGRRPQRRCWCSRAGAGLANLQIEYRQPGAVTSAPGGAPTAHRPSGLATRGRPARSPRGRPNTAHPRISRRSNSGCAAELASAARTRGDRHGAGGDRRQSPRRAAAGARRSSTRRERAAPQGAGDAAGRGRPRRRGAAAEPTSCESSRTCDRSRASRASRPRDSAR